MKQQFLTILAACITLFFSSCFKEENPVQRKDRGSVESGSMELGADYARQVYFSLHTKQQVQTIGKYSWDIGLSANSAQPFITLNTSKTMYAYKTDKNSLFELGDTAGKMAVRLNDYPCGSADSMALSGILSAKTVYILDLGYNADLQRAGYLLLMARIIDGNYRIEYCNLDGSNYQSKQISFDPTCNMLFLNFKTQELIPEPKTAAWDLLITQYQHVYYDPFQTYSVVGCLINQSTIMACAYKGDKTFADVRLSDTADCVFSNRKNTIGFDWKYYDLNNSLYTVNAKKTYFIRRNTGNIYKLHFINFYSNTGIKGTATFEFQEL
jgi:hypothetical protein